MNTSVIQPDHEIATVIDVVERRTVAFMRDELGLVAERIERRTHHEECVVLRSMTAIVGVGSRAGLYIAYSYDEPLIRLMTTQYTKGLTIPPGQEDLYARETASDVLNVIVGNCTADLARRGQLISLSPPVLMAGARTIQRRAETSVAAITLQFTDGALDIAFVGPRISFDDQLNYQGGLS
jgi:CheY-specific phosphatase CheX